MNSLRQVTFEGTVFSGEGRGKCFMMLPWVKRQIMEKLGFEAYQGTLNIRLIPQSTEKRSLLVPEKGLPVQPESGYYYGALFLAEIKKVKGAVVLPLVPDYPEDLLEVVAPVYLRGTLGLKDEDRVTVEVSV